MNPIYQPSTIGMSIFALVFYLVMAAFALYSLLTLYSLLRFGRSLIVTIIVSVIYLIIAGGLYAAAVTNLNLIKF